MVCLEKRDMEIHYIYSEQCISQIFDKMKVSDVMVKWKKKELGILMDTHMDCTFPFEIFWKMMQ